MSALVYDQDYLISKLTEQESIIKNLQNTSLKTNLLFECEALELEETVDITDDQQSLAKLNSHRRIIVDIICDLERAKRLRKTELEMHRLNQAFQQNRLNIDATHTFDLNDQAIVQEFTRLLKKLLVCQSVYLGDIELPIAGDRIQIISLIMNYLNDRIDLRFLQIGEYCVEIVRSEFIILIKDAVDLDTLYLTHESSIREFEKIMCEFGLQFSPINLKKLIKQEQLNQKVMIARNLIDNILQDLVETEIKGIKFTVSQSIIDLFKMIDNDGQDILDIYLCKIYTIKTSASEKIIIYNECVLLENSVLPYQNCIYFALKFRDMAQKYLNQLNNTESTCINEIISEADGFDCDTTDRFERVGIAVQKLEDHFDSLSIKLQTTSPRIKLIILGGLYDHVIDVISTQIYDFIDIGEQESERLSQLLHLDAIDQLFLGHVGIYAKRHGSFKTLVELLTWSFKSIMDHFRMGALCDFEITKLIGLVRALFSDTELRRKNIREIQIGHP